MGLRPQLYKLSGVLLYSILAVITGANSFRCIATFIHVHRIRLNAAFGLRWKRAPAHTAIRSILQGLDPASVEQVFRRHATGLQPCGAKAAGAPNGSLWSRRSSASPAKFCIAAPRPACGAAPARSPATWPTPRPGQAASPRYPQPLARRKTGKLHYTRDVTFLEDKSRIRRNPGIFARVRSFAYNILRRNQANTFNQDSYAAALGGLDAVFALVVSQER
jgi:hypothetical protein